MSISFFWHSKVLPIFKAHSQPTYLENFWSLNFSQPHYCMALLPIYSAPLQALLKHMYMCVSVTRLCAFIHSFRNRQYSPMVKSVHGKRVAGAHSDNYYLCEFSKLPTFSLCLSLLISKVGIIVPTSSAWAMVS